MNEEITRRRTFAIISHPDAGKTTLTEKLLLFGGQIQVAGAVKSNKIKKSATSDWMEIEKQRRFCMRRCSCCPISILLTTKKTRLRVGGFSSMHGRPFDNASTEPHRCVDEGPTMQRVRTYSYVHAHA